jgi:Icc protein
MLLTGDLVSDEPAGYRHIRRLLGGLGLPILCIPGNHDEPRAMEQELAGEPFILGGTLDREAWRIVLLSTHVAGATHGYLSEPSLVKLEEALVTAAGRHCLVCLHHHPVEIGSRWLDTIGLKNAAQLLEIIDRHDHVRAILWGHVHQSFEAQRKGVRLLATPSTCAQFLPGSDDFAVDRRPPGYRTLTLRADGSLLTEVVWLEKRPAGSSRSAFSAA